MTENEYKKLPIKEVCGEDFINCPESGKEENIVACQGCPHWKPYDENLGPVILCNYQPPENTGTGRCNPESPDMQIFDLKVKLHEARMERDGLKTENSALKEKLERLRGLVSPDEQKYHSRINALESERDELRDDAANLAAEIELLRVRIKIFERKARGEKEAAKSILRKFRELHQKQMGDAKTVIVNLLSLSTITEADNFLLEAPPDEVLFTFKAIQDDHSNEEHDNAGE